MSSFYSVFLRTKSAVSVFERIDYCREVIANGGEPRCMLISGPSGVGKSRILEEYRNQNPPIKQVGFYQIPVLLTRIAERPTIIDTAYQMLENLGQGAISHVNQERTLVRMLKGLLSKCKTEVIIVDEFQELIEFKTDEEIVRIANWLKHLSSEVRIPIILVGTCWSKKILKEAQWESRMMYKININPFSFECEDDKEEYRKVLKGLAERLPLVEKPSLDVNEFAIPLIIVTEGKFRKLKWLLEDALNEAIKNDDVSLKKAHIITSLAKDDELSPELLAIFSYSINNLAEYLALKYAGEIEKAKNILKISKKLSLPYDLPAVLSKNK